MFTMGLRTGVGRLASHCHRVTALETLFSKGTAKVPGSFCRGIPSCVREGRGRERGEGEGRGEEGRREEGRGGGGGEGRGEERKHYTSLIPQPCLLAARQQIKINVGQWKGPGHKLTLHNACANSPPSTSRLCQGGFPLLPECHMSVVHQRVRKG